MVWKSNIHFSSYDVCIIKDRYDLANIRVGLSMWAKISLQIFKWEGGVRKPG